MILRSPLGRVSLGVMLASSLGALPASTRAEGPQPCQGGVLLVGTDRFTGKANISFHESPRVAASGVAAEPWLNLSWTEGLPIAVLTFNQESTAPRYKNCAIFAMLADGVRVSIGSARVTSTAGEGSVREAVEVDLSREALEQLSTAAKVEYRVCATEFEMRDGQLCGAHAFAKQVLTREASAPKAAKPRQKG